MSWRGSFKSGHATYRFYLGEGDWVRRASAALAPDGSLFLNVGGKPTEKALASSRSGLDQDLAVGHYKPINSKRFLHDCHEFVFHFTPEGDTPLDRQAIGVRYQDPSNVARWRTAASGVRCRGNTRFIPYETIQSREKDRPHPATFSSAPASDVPAPARS